MEHHLLDLICDCSPLQTLPDVKLVLGADGQYHEFRVPQKDYLILHMFKDRRIPDCRVNVKSLDR